MMPRAPISETDRTLSATRLSRKGRNRHHRKHHIDVPTESHVDTHFKKQEGDSDFKIAGWCFSHLPGCGCFISHHCANPRSKQVCYYKSLTCNNDIV